MKAPSPTETVEAGHRGERDVIDRAVEAADPAVRSAAIGALLRIGALDAAVLDGFFADPEPTVRRRAAELAHRIPEPGGTELGLVGLLADAAEIAEVAAFALGEIGSGDGCRLDRSTVAALETMAVSHDDALCREAAVAALGALHEGLDTILTACGDRATVRRRAIIALAPFDGPAVDDALRTALSDRDWQVRQAAEDLLGGTAPPDR